MNLQELAKQQLADYDRHQPGTCFTNDALALTVEEAYVLQMEVARLRQERGEPLAGYKVGCISPAIQAQLGLDQPVFGHVYHTELLSSGAVLDPARYEGLAVEGEFAVRLAEDIPDAGWLRTRLSQVVATAFPVIELHNSVFRRSPHSAQELIANNAIHAGVVLPQVEQSMHATEVLLHERIVVRKNGEVLGSATGRALPDFPFGSIVLLADHLARFGCNLRRGQLVLIGSPLPLYRVWDGDRIEVICPSSSVAAMATVQRSVAAI